MKELQVSLVCLPEVEASTLYGVSDALAATGRLWERFTGTPDSPNCLFAPVIVGDTSEPFVTGFGSPVVPQATFRDIERTDIVYIPSLLIDDLEDFAGRNRGYISWIREQYEKGALIASACTGTLMLAETGLLDGCEVTSHWAAASLIRAHHPNILLAEQRVLSFAGEGQRLITAGGASSWQDLVLYLIMRFAGMDTARQISKIFLFQWHRDGQSPFAALQRNAQHDDAAIGQAQIWLADNYARDRALAAAIETSGLQERTFNRRFRAATGYSPSEYLQSLRIEEAKQLLESTAIGVGDIANAVGYSDEASFRRLFRRLVGLSPAEYRRRYAFPELAGMA